MMFACSSEVPKSSADYIKSFALPAIDSLLLDAPLVDNEKSTIYIHVEPKDYGHFDSVAPRIELWEGATVEPPSDQVVDLQDTALRYVVTAEDPSFTRSYRVEIDSTAPTHYSFNDWSLAKGSLTYFISAYAGWTSGNAGIGLALSILGRNAKDPYQYPTQMTDSGYSGAAVKMQTIEGGNIFNREIPIWSGNFLFGFFDVTDAIIDELRATKVGRRYLSRPDSLVGYFKYRQGPGVYNNNGTPDPAQSDSCNIYGILYQSDVGSKGDTILAVLDAEVSDLRVAEARLGTHTTMTCTDTPGDDFVRFSIPFSYTIDGVAKELDFENHRYKLGITFSASKKGGAIDAEGNKSYAGKVGSVLIVDEVEVKNAE
jgi:hypothetical protein